jgi:hypothetical protein
MSLARIADLNKPIEEIQPYIEMARQLSKLYDDFLENFKEDKSHRPAGIHASELNKCLRQTYYSVIALEKKNITSLNMRRRFHMGHAVHDMVQRELHKMAAMAQAEQVAQQNGWYLEFEDEVKVSPAHQELAEKYKIYSSCDGVFTFRELEHGDPVLRVGLEIKTENPDSYDKLTGPKKEHVEQVHVYMACLDLPLVWFFYMNKGNQNTTPSSSPWLLPFNPQVWFALEQRAQTVLQHEAAGSEPLREEGNHCGFCPYEWKCNPPSRSRQKNYISVRRP